MLVEKAGPDGGPPIEDGLLGGAARRRPGNQGGPQMGRHSGQMHGEAENVCLTMLGENGLGARAQRPPDGGTSNTALEQCFPYHVHVGQEKPTDSEGNQTAPAARSVHQQ